jgi:hypothetical protein
MHEGTCQTLRSDVRSFRLWSASQPAVRAYRAQKCCFITCQSLLSQDRQLRGARALNNRKLANENMYLKCWNNNSVQLISGETLAEGSEVTYCVVLRTPTKANY